MSRIKTRQGFTIVELMFSMGFVAVLLMAIAAIVAQMSVTYNQGITLREVNQAGRYVVDTMTRDIAATQPFSISQALISSDAGGRLCMGAVSYIWSSTDVLQDGADTSHATVYGDGQPVRFARVEDPGGQYCQYDADGELETTVDYDKSAELLSDGQRDLVLRQFVISEVPDGDVGPKLYIVRATIGTNDSEFISVSGDNRCEPSEDTSRSDESYCAINEFKFVARAGNLE